jgi:hypothetical protein
MVMLSQENQEPDDFVFESALVSNSNNNQADGLDLAIQNQMSEVNTTQEDLDQFYLRKAKGSAHTAATSYLQKIKPKPGVQDSYGFTQHPVKISNQNALLSLLSNEDFSQLKT